jgi:multidrug efflux pump subunit AcrA (membrane-fusion protein)
MKKKQILILIGITIISVVLYLSFGLNDDEIVVEEIKEFDVKLSDILIDFPGDGNIVMSESELSFETSGTIDQILKFEGELIKSGEIIAILNQEKAKLDLEQAQIAYDTELEKVKQANLDYKYNLTSQEGRIIELENQLSNEKTTMSAMENYPSLYAAIDVKNQKDSVLQLENDLKAENLKLASIKESSTAIESLTLLDKENRLESAKLVFEGTIITAPFDGKIGQINGNVNEYISSNTPFVLIQNVDSPFVSSMISELDIHLVSEEQKAYLEFESDYGIKYEAVVTYVSSLPQIDQNGIITYEVRLKPLEYPESLKSGLSTMITFVQREKNDVLVIPNSSVSIVDNKQYVELKTTDGSKVQEIITGLTDGTNVEVISGLNVGDTIISRTTK